MGRKAQRPNTGVGGARIALRRPYAPLAWRCFLCLSRCPPCCHPCPSNIHTRPPLNTPIIVRWRSISPHYKARNNRLMVSTRCWTVLRGPAAQRLAATACDDVGSCWPEQGIDIDGGAPKTAAALSARNSIRSSNLCRVDCTDLVPRS